MRYLIVILILVVLAACGPSAAEQTAVAEYDAASTAINFARTTATVVFARMQTTLEYAGTLVGMATAQTGQLRATLIANGTEPAYITTTMPRAGVFIAPTDAPRTAVPAAPGITVTAGQAIPGEPTLQPSVVPDNQLSSFVMTTAVGENGCATVASPQFTPATEEIYIVATARGIPANTTIASRWRDPSGAEIAYYPFTPDYDITQECIWFFIDQTDAPFVPGRWSVTLEVNEAPVGSAIPFVISEGDG